MEKTSTIDTIMAAVADAMAGIERERLDASPYPRPIHSLKHKPSAQRVDTSAQGTLPAASASIHSASSITNSPSWSYSGSPYAFQPQTSLSTFDNFNLPEPVLSPSSASHALASSFPRQNGLTRKISSGRRALSRLGRTASSGALGRREPSSGPVARRRSDSKTSTMAAFDTEEPIPDIPDGLSVHGLGPTEDADSVSDFHTRADHRAEIVAPAVPQILLRDDTVKKLNNNKYKYDQKDFGFCLEQDGTAIKWHGKFGTTKTVYVDDIKTIRHGDEAECSWADVAGPNIDPNRCFTISYARNAVSKDTKTLHLLAKSTVLCQSWVKTLNDLSKHREELMSEMTGTERPSVLRAHWESELAKQRTESRSTETGGLDLVTVVRLCRKLHIHCPRYVVEEVFHNSATKSTSVLDFEQFRAFVARLRLRVDLKPLFNQIKTPVVDGISKDEFLLFLRREQGVNVDANFSYWIDRFDGFAGSSRSSGPGSSQFMDFAGFTSFMMSRDCHVYAPTEKTQLSLDRPINEYFISSSHNTYLTGWQVHGTSSVEQYVTALRKGCRSVEIDCWDGENNNPKVTHGFTNTTSVPFADVVRAINRCAFEASSYPVILSLEVHCNPVQQLRMVDIMKEIIGVDRLLLYPLMDYTSTLPSPESLRHKILIKVKATNAHPVIQALTESMPIVRQRSTSSPVRSTASNSIQPAQYQLNAIGTPAMLSPAESIASPTDQSTTPTSEEDCNSDLDGNGGTLTEPTTPRKTSKITKELAALGVYMQGYSYRSPVDLAFQQFNHIYSINENTAATVSKQQDSKVPFEKHNTSFLCRIYPKGARFNSSNFDPNTFWRRGVQMVALNWQTYDIHMQMNQAMFAARNDRTGYVLKPDYLRDAGRFDTALGQKTKLPHYDIKFSVKVISAQQLPLISTLGKKKLISPFVEVQIFSAEDKARGIAKGYGGEEVSRTNSYHGIGNPYSRRTKTVPENGFNPQFNDVIELSLHTKYPELVFVRFVISSAHKNSHKELAVFTAKLNSLQQGYRHLPLYNSNGEELIFSTLFCHITKKKPVEIHHEAMPSRHGSFRKLLSRSNTTERGRQHGHALADSERLSAQKQLNKEIEANRR